MEAPPGEDKLAMLSEIAQEHGVEWDAHNAALEMLPSDTGMQNASPGYQQQLLDITGAGMLGHTPQTAPVHSHANPDPSTPPFPPPPNASMCRAGEYGWSGVRRKQGAPRHLMAGSAKLPHGNLLGSLVGNVK